MHKRSQVKDFHTQSIMNFFEIIYLWHVSVYTNSFPVKICTIPHRVIKWIVNMTSLNLQQR